MKYCGAMALLCWLAVAQSAAAVDRSVSHSDWKVSANRILLRYTLPKSRAQRLVGPGWPAPSTATVGRYVLDHMSVSAGGKPCPAIDQGYDLGQIDPLYAGPDLYGFEIMFRCPHPDSLVLHDGAMFDKVSEHTDFATVQINGGASVRRLITSRTQQLPLPNDDLLKSSGIIRYLGAGFEHFVFGLDHMAFLCGLLLLARGRVALGCMALGLVFGYGAAAALGAAGLIAPYAGAAEAWIGFMVLFVAVLVVAEQTRRPRLISLVTAAALLLLAVVMALTRHFEAALMSLGAGIFAGGFLRVFPETAARSALWILPTLAFGFLDGFTLPTDVSTLHLPSLLPGFAMFGFNLGAILAAMLLAGLIVAAAVLLRRTCRTLPALLARDLSATLLAGLGAFWFLTGLYA